MVHKGSASKYLLFFGDVFVLLLALILTLAVRYRSWPETEVLTQHLLPFTLLILIWTVIFFIVGLYDRFVLFARKELPAKVIRTQVINILLAVVLFFVLPFGISPKTNLVIYLVISVALILVWRLYLYPRLTTAHAIHALVIGAGEEAAEVTRVLKQNPYFQQVDVDHIDTSQYYDESRVVASLTEYLQEHQIDIVIADMNESLTQELSAQFFTLAFFERRLTFMSLTEFYEQLFHRIPPSIIGESWLLENITPHATHSSYTVVRRGIDVLGALVLMVPCLFIFPLVIAALKFQDGGAIFYRTTRIGQFNQPISIYKFRTMNGCDTGTQALKSQLFVTPLGLVLRKLRIDELPQLLNVLRGDLSFIGPRPEIPELVAVYANEIPYYNLRHLIKPGLSGWAQINNYDVPRQGVDVERTIAKLSFDLYYLRKRTLLLDIEIALKTINTVLSRTGT